MPLRRHGFSDLLEIGQKRMFWTYYLAVNAWARVQKCLAKFLIFQKWALNSKGILLMQVFLLFESYMLYREGIFNPNPKAY